MHFSQNQTPNDLLRGPEFDHSGNNFEFLSDSKNTFLEVLFPDEESSNDY